MTIAHMALRPGELKTTNFSYPKKKKKKNLMCEKWSGSGKKHSPLPPKS
jgi:hypothetical protein